MNFSLTLSRGAKFCAHKVIFWISFFAYHFMINIFKIHINFVMDSFRETFQNLEPKITCKFQNFAENCIETPLFAIIVSCNNSISIKLFKIICFCCRINNER